MKISYGKRVHDVVDAALEIINAANTERKQLDQKMKDGIIAQKRYGETVAELQRRKDRAVVDANLAIEEIRREHEAAVDAWNVLDGSKIDHDDAELLRLCDRMSAQQFQQLCTKHKENSVMLGLLADYSERHADLGLIADRPIDAKTRLTNFNTFCATASRAVEAPDTLSAAMFLDGRGDLPGTNYSYGSDGES